MVKNTILTILLCVFSVNTFAKAKRGWKKHYKSVYPAISHYEEVKVIDTISDSQVNTKIFKIFRDKKLLGFVREIATTTGCNSACLPLTYTIFFNDKGEYLRLESKSGLTKKDHAMFTAEDYGQLDVILSMNPQVFTTVIHPKEMTDAISGETLKKFKSYIVKEAAYSTLRINLYHQNTMKEIQKILNEK